MQDVLFRPNSPNNVLVGLDIMKSGLGCGDEKLYESFIIDMQAPFALDYENLNDGTFAIRTLTILAAG